MKKIGRFISYLYLHMDLGFILRAYSYAVMFTAVMLYSGRSHNSLGWTIYCLICTVVFPFGYLAAHDLLTILPFGGIFLVTFTESVIVTLFIWLLKFVLYLMVWIAGIITAPLGILYIVLGDVFASWSERWKNKR